MPPTRTGPRTPKKARKRPKPRPGPRAARAVPGHHWDWPVTFRSDGSRQATLAEYVDPSVPTLALAELSRAQSEEVVLARLAKRRHLALVLGNGGFVDRVRAMTEVRHHTAVGDVIAELELRMMRRLIKHASPARPERAFPPTKGRK